MRRYETTFIVNPQADDAAIDRQVAAVSDLIKNEGGQILYENRMGTRRLAYPIAGLVQGFYSSFIFDAEPGVLPKLERHYKLEEPYVRYLTIVYEGTVPSDEETEDTAAEESAPKPAEAKPAEAKSDEGEAPEAKTEAKAEAEAEEKPAEEKPAEEKPVEDEAAEAEKPKTDAPAPTDSAEEEL